MLAHAAADADGLAIGLIAVTIIGGFVFLELVARRRERAVPPDADREREGRDDPD